MRKASSYIWLLFACLALAFPILVAAQPPAPTPTAVSVAVPLNGQWTDTGVDLQKGDALTIVVAQPVAPNRNVSMIRLYLLLGRMGAGTAPFLVGFNYKGNAPATGRLLLAVSGGRPDTPGSLQATISYTPHVAVTPTPATPTPRATPATTPTSTSTPTSSPTLTPTPTSASSPTSAPSATATPLSVPVPNVVGLAADDAAARIEKSTLRPVRRTETRSCQAQGRVTRTQPLAGSPVRPGSEVVYWTASGENVVPDVYALSLGDAAAALQAACFRLGRVISGAQLGGNVRIVRQDPAAWTTAPVGTAVAVTLGGRIPGWVLIVLLVVAAAIAGAIGTAILRPHPAPKITRYSARTELVDGPTNFPQGIHNRFDMTVEDGVTVFQGDIPIVKREVLR